MSEIDLLAVQRGTVTAPAGCGKTHLIAEALKQHDAPKPILALTHTNAGVAALRGRLDKAGVPARAYRLATLDGWAMRMIGMFPMRSGIKPSVLRLERPAQDYPRIRSAAWRLFSDGHIADVLAANFSRLIVDEYQDCNATQHAIITWVAQTLPTCVLGDPMQAIFGWQGVKMPDWDGDVCRYFRPAGELETPWRWVNAGTEKFGRWLLDVRHALRDGRPVDLRAAPPEVAWVDLDGSEDRVRQIRAAGVRPVDKDGSVLIIGDSKSPPSQRDFAAKIRGAVTVESVDLRDMVEFARRLDFGHAAALAQVVDFAAEVMTNVGAPDLMKRIDILERGAGRKEASAAEQAALRFKMSPSPTNAVALLSELSRQGGVETHRPTILRATISALQSCDAGNSSSFYEAAVQAREQNRLLGRPLPRRAVGSTLLLKGLEADTSVILDAADLGARDLYVAMTRGAKRLVICSDTPVLTRTP